MSYILVYNFKHIRRLNANGINKPLRNIRAIQQNLVNVISMPEKGLEKAKTYYELLQGGGEVQTINSQF